MRTPQGLRPARRERLLLVPERLLVRIREELRQSLAQALRKTRDVQIRGRRKLTNLPGEIIGWVCAKAVLEVPRETTDMVMASH